MFKNDNKIPYPEISMDEAIKNGGYYDINGRWNNLTVFEDYPGKVFRGRVETLIMDGNRVYLNIGKKKYRIPGGSMEKDTPDIIQAKIECKEESKILVKDVIDTNINYIEEFEKIHKYKSGEMHWDGRYNKVYLSTFSDWYKGRINYIDRDPDMLVNGKFYNIDKVYDMLNPYHKQAIDKYLIDKNANIIKKRMDSDLKLTAIKLSEILNRIKNLNDDRFNHVIRRSVENYEDGYIFGECHHKNKEEFEYTLRLIDYFQNIIDTTIYVGQVYRPDEYQDRTILMLIPDNTAINTLAKHNYELNNNTKNQYPITESFAEDQLNINDLIHDDMFNYLIESNTKEKKKPIFIVTSFTNTSFGKVIAKYTKSTYTHAAIAFDTALDKMYSFNADNKNNKFGGMSIESIQEYLGKYEDARISVSTFFVKESDFNKIQDAIDNIYKNIKNTVYGFGNLINIILNRAIKLTADTQDKLSLVCSEFVAWVCSLADIKLIDKAINLITPKDLSNLQNPRIYKLYEGLIREYDKTKIDRIFRKLKRKAEFIKESYNEDIIEEMKRSELNDSDFGIPEERKYPLNDEKHVISAIKFFNYVNKKYEEELAKNIISKMKKYNISGSRVGKKNRLRKYLPSNMVEESITINNNLESLMEMVSVNMDNILNEDYSVLNEQSNIIYPYFTPKELKDLKVFTNECVYEYIDDTYRDFYNEYSSNLIPNSKWIDMVREEYHKGNKSHVLELGWNPEIDPTYDNIIKASNITKRKLKIEL